MFKTQLRISKLLIEESKLYDPSSIKELLSTPNNNEVEISIMGTYNEFKETAFTYNGMRMLENIFLESLKDKSEDFFKNITNIYDTFANENDQKIKEFDKLLEEEQYAALFSKILDYIKLLEQQDIDTINFLNKMKDCLEELKNDNSLYSKYPSFYNFILQSIFNTHMLLLEFYNNIIDLTINNISDISQESEDISLYISSLQDKMQIELEEKQYIDSIDTYIKIIDILVIMYKKIENGLIDEEKRLKNQISNLLVEQEMEKINNNS